MRRQGVADSDIARCNGTSAGNLLPSEGDLSLPARTGRED